MTFAAVETLTPQLGTEALAQLADRALRQFMAETGAEGFARAKTRLIILRSKLARYKKLFESGTIREEAYFHELRRNETELAEILSIIRRENTPGGASDAFARLERDIGQALREVSEARARMVFISYRRDDTVYIADRLAHHIGSRLGREVVFRDTHTIEPGEDFTRCVNEALGRTRVCLVLIGQRWRGVRPDGSSRITELDDFVRHEVSTALARRITVMPVLLEGVRPEELKDLPPDIAGIRSRNAFFLRPDPDFDHDMERVTGFLVRRLT